jgi:hypothetical protein
MVRDPSIHAQHIQRVHGVKGSPLLDFIAEADAPIQLVPKLTRPYEVQHLLMQVDKLGPQRRLVGLRRRAAMADVDDVDILPRQPIERFDPTVIVKV